MKKIIYTDKIEKYVKTPEIYRLSKTFCFEDFGGMGKIKELKF